MQPIPGVGSVTAGIPATSSEALALTSLAAKVATGDLASECMALLAEDNACQVKANLQGICVQQRMIRQARQRRMELLKKHLEASKKSGFWSKLGKIFGGIASALAGVLTFFCPPAGVGAAALGGAMVSGGCRVVGGVYASTAGRTSADILQAEQHQRVFEEARDQLLQSLQEASQLERRMAARISALAESEQQIVVIR